MDHSNQPIGERVARLELKMEQFEEIKDKLDELLELKHKGIGAFWLVGLLISSGVLGILGIVFGLFRGHA